MSRSLGASAEQPETGASSERSMFLEAVLRALVDPVFVLDYNGRYLGVFGASERNQYDSPDYLVGRSLHDVMPEALADGFLADIRRVIDTGQVHLNEYCLSADECEGNPKDGPQGTQWFQGRIAPLDRAVSGGVQAVAWVVVNISERKRLEGELQRLANSDELTGLMNRRAFLREAAVALQAAVSERRQLRLQFALLDLDLFKSINDHYGHLVGDAVLKHVSQIVGKVSAEVAILARIGGEEFALLFPDATLDEAVEVLRRARDSLRACPLELGTERIAVDFSAGVCGVESIDRHPSDLLRRADQYLYLAKDAGRGRIAFPGWVERRGH